MKLKGWLCDREGNSRERRKRPRAACNPRPPFRMGAQDVLWQRYSREMWLLVWMPAL